MHDFLKEAQGMAEKLTAFRHDLHRHPEVGMDLPRTTKKVEEVLEKAGIPYSNPIPSSILVVLKGGSPGKTLLLRADMDALPMGEESGVDYASQEEGKMHSCGHDLHAPCSWGLPSS